jgi:predicted RNA-binding Zn ribbon-like protein
MVTAAGQRLHDASGGILPLDFVNTVDRSVGKPWVDRLGDYGDLVRWSTLAGSLPEPAARRLARSARRQPREAGEVLERARLLREAFYRVFGAMADGGAPAPADLARLNHELGVALAHARVEPAAEGFAWGWGSGRGGPALDSPLWPLARAAAELLVSAERDLVRRCASETCLWLFLDRTKNHRRRWCDMKVCGNRTKVRAYRRRRAKAAGLRAE